MATLRSMTVLDVADVTASVAFYQRLGFASHGIWDGSFAIVQRGQVTLALSKAAAVVPRNHGWAAYIYVDALDDLHGEFATLELPYLSDIERPDHYGCDDFTIKDIDGHMLAFGQSRNPVPGPGLDEDQGRG